MVRVSHGRATASMQGAFVARVDLSRLGCRIGLVLADHGITPANEEARACSAIC